MRNLHLPMELRNGPFTLTQALAVGVTKRQLMHPRFRRLLHGVYVAADHEDTVALRFAAVRLVLPRRGVARGLTAAWLHGVDVRRLGDVDIHVGFPAGQRIRSQPGLIVCQETLEPSDILELQGVLVTSATRTAFDGLRFLRDPEGVVVADALTHISLTTVDELVAYFGSKRRLRNLRIGEGRLADVEPKADSPMETRTRISLVRRGVPRPQVPIYVFDSAHNFLGRADMGYEELRLVIEYDGQVHWDRQQEDERRRQAMRDAGWLVIVLYADDIYLYPDRTADRVLAAIRRREREFGVRI